MKQVITLMEKLKNQNFYGKLTLQYRKGEIVHLIKEQSLKITEEREDRE